MSERGRGSFSLCLVFRDCRLGQQLDCNLARDPVPCLDANRNDKARRGNCRSDVFKKMKDDLIAEHRFSSTSLFNRNESRVFEYRYRKVGELIVEK